MTSSKPLVALFSLPVVSLSTRRGHHRQGLYLHICAAVVDVARGTSEVCPIRIVEEILLDDLCQREVEERLHLAQAHSERWVHGS